MNGLMGNFQPLQTRLLLSEKGACALSRAHDRKFNYELDSSLGGAV